MRWLTFICGFLPRWENFANLKMFWQTLTAYGPSSWTYLLNIEVIIEIWPVKVDLAFLLHKGDSSLKHFWCIKDCVCEFLVMWKKSILIEWCPVFRLRLVLMILLLLLQFLTITQHSPGKRLLIPFLPWGSSTWRSWGWRGIHLFDAHKIACFFATEFPQRWFLCNLKVLQGERIGPKIAHFGFKYK